MPECRLFSIEILELKESRLERRKRGERREEVEVCVDHPVSIVNT